MRQLRIDDGKWRSIEIKVSLKINKREMKEEKVKEKKYKERKDPDGKEKRQKNSSCMTQ